MNEHDLIATWASLLRVSESDVSRLVLRAPYQYQHYQIPKRTGGFRDIYHPTPNLKSIQRWLVNNKISALPVHNSVYSYRSGVGIHDHAAVHLQSNFLLRLDFSNFFPSIDDSWLREFLFTQVDLARLAIDKGAIAILIRVLCRFSKTERTMALSIGAPSSPALSNAILFEVDERLTQQCASLDCTYTRYADDLYVSARVPNRLRDAEAAMRAIIGEFAPRLKVNEKKTTNVSKKTSRVVTGLVITPDRRVSIGRDMKRSIKTQVHLSSIGALSAEDASRLGGLVAYVKDVEPAFYVALVAKFGEATLERLLQRKYSDTFPMLGDQLLRSD